MGALGTVNCRSSNIFLGLSMIGTNICGSLRNWERQKFKHSSRVEHDRGKHCCSHRNRQLQNFKHLLMFEHVKVRF